MKHIISLRKEAKNWEGGLPVGNGRLGASVLGKAREEIITINEETVWYGPDHNRKNKDCRENLEKIKQLLAEGRLQDAHFLARMTMTATPKYLNPYQPACELRVIFNGHRGKDFEDRKCYLDLDDAIAYVSYDRFGVHYERSHFVSQKYNVFVMRITGSEAKQLTVQTHLMRKPFDEYTDSIGEDIVCNYGQCGPDGVHYYTAAKMVAKGGNVTTVGDFAYVNDADEITIYLAAETDFNGNDSYKDNVLERINKAAKVGYEEILREHLEWYHKMNERTTFELNGSKFDGRITAEQIEELREMEEPENDYLVMLLYAFAKYLMVSSSYECQLPANLQGIWNGEFVPPWQSEYTININCQMNYWMAEKCNLSECHMPLFDLIERMVEKGKATAKTLYGCEGFVAHHNTGLWANTDPEGSLDASPFWVMGGAWLALHMYEHYLYTLDEKFLKDRALYVMREALRFFEGYLTETEDGYLVTGPTVSPENTYYSEIGEAGCLSMGPTMDIQILRQLCKAYLHSASVVGESDGVDIISDMLSKLPPTQIAEDGRIMEWQKDYKEVSKGHRHISHLYGLHPGNEITKETPELFKAAKETLRVRLENGGGHTGWSRAWVTCFYARLGDGEKVYENIMQLLIKSIKDNLYDTHPPFQIDGNFGIAAAMVDAIVQSHAGFIELLPALPSKWKSGKMTGLRLRGAITCDIAWEDNKPSEVVLTADKDSEVDVVYKDKKITVTLEAGKPYTVTI